ncbi:hypothetical protein F2P81_020993 [Scophthalmus maximus]|uniref:Uncharacterized protein n=1 Tax=Scophthalmus maximus TaxID=52904 RepID=A0A6A4RU77_SCOMX|nr:hypothetical protein F2P81_020993 [Scophthalmus maximus]
MKVTLTSVADIRNQLGHPDWYSPPSPMFRTNECESEHFLVLTLDEVVIDHPGRSESPQQSNMALYLVVVVLPTAISMPLWYMVIEYLQANNTCSVFIKMFKRAEGPEPTQHNSVQLLVHQSIVF